MKTLRTLALLLCIVMLIPAFAACSSSDDEGAYITMYLTDDCFDFDPANAAYYDAASQNVISLMFDTLFTLDKNGKVQKSLVKDYKIKEDKVTGVVTMDVTLNEAYWSNGTRLSSNDVLYTFQRLVNPANNFASASLLYDVKNARAIKEGDATIDDIGIEANGIDSFRITFEGKVDYDQFLLNLTSLATAPLLENYVKKNPDWAKKSSTIVTSGAYKLSKIVYSDYEENGKSLKVSDNNATQKDGSVKSVRSNQVKEISYFILERNVYYYRNAKKDDPIDKTVKNYRLLVDCRMTDEELLDAYRKGQLFYIGEIPLSIRGEADVKKEAKVSDALSTFTCLLNEDAEISGEKLFANADVRRALSLALDREAIANAVVFAEAASALVPHGVFKEGAKKDSKDFRTTGGDLISTSAKVEEAKALLNSAGITSSRYSFTIKVAAFDDVNVAIATMIADTWKDTLGFKVSVEKVYPIQNNDYFKEVDDVPADVCDDLFLEALQNKDFEVIAFDLSAYSADAASMLDCFARPFAGGKLDMDTYELEGHITGYQSDAYDALIEAVYYLPYFAELNENSDDFLGLYDSHEEYLAAYRRVKEVYDANGITPSTKSSDWAWQKATLLHKAEELLLADMPVIPVVFNKTAVLQSNKLSGVKSDYYTPALFKTAKLQNYKKYIPVFEEFPTLDWSKLK
ncbi:MAG: hypothetical protein IJR88_02795 [Clostridia bacterium]|nr:hypothetical protein [Clostridia bacterium]